jgi:hypothetical protein
VILTRTDGPLLPDSAAVDIARRDLFACIYCIQALGFRRNVAMPVSQSVIVNVRGVGREYRKVWMRDVIRDA